MAALPRIAKLKRFRYLPQDGGGTVYFKADFGRLGVYLAPEDVPEFDGEEGWFELIRAPGAPRTRWKAIRQIDPPRGS